MSNQTAVNAVSSAAIIWIAVLGVIVGWKLLTQTICLRGLLHGDLADGGTYFSPGRVQLLMTTLLFAGDLLMQAIAHPGQFPTIPQEFLVALGGSQAVYLFGKARAMLN